MAELGGKRVDVRRGVRAEADQVRALVGVAAQPHDVLLGRALGGQVGDAVLTMDLGESPEAGEEVALLVEVRYREVDVAQVADQS